MNPRKQALRGVLLWRAGCTLLSVNAMEQPDEISNLVFTSGYSVPELKVAVSGKIYRQISSSRRQSRGITMKAQVPPIRKVTQNAQRPVQHDPPTARAHGYEPACLSQRGDTELRHDVLERVPREIHT